MQDQISNNNIVSNQTVTSTPIGSQVPLAEKNSKLAGFLKVFKWITLFFVVMSFGAPLMWGRDWHWTWVSPIISILFLISSWASLKKQKTKSATVLMIISFLISALAGLGIVMVFIAIAMLCPIVFSLGGGGH